MRVPSLLAAAFLFLPKTAAPVTSAAVQGDATLPGVTIAVAREGAHLRITFAGRLQSAPTPNGPWSDVAQTSPHLQSPTGPGAFYRSQGWESIFASRSVVDLTLTGPLQTHFDRAYAGTPDGIVPPKREKEYFDALVQVGELEVPASVRVRGNSSLQECPFPKLKFKISKEDRPGTPFFDAREIKIGTHCAEGGRGNIGRLRDETATFREALAYEVTEMLGFTAPRVRRARIEYRDTSPESPNSAAGWEISRNALLLDDVEVLAERLGGRPLEEPEVAALTRADFDEVLLAALQLLHAFLGNWDYNLPLDGPGLWNTDVLETAEGRLVPVAGDFDLASWVTAVVRLSAPHEYHPELGDLERQARYSIEQVQGHFSASDFASAVNRFTRQREAIESAIGAAQVDEEGRANALHHLEAFFDALVVLQPTP